MSMNATLYGEKKGNKELCVENSLNVAGSGKKWYGIHTYKPNGEWDNVAEIMMINFCESGHPVFRGSSALERGDLKSKGKGKLSFHFNVSDETVEVVFRTITSVNQLFTNQ